MKKKLGLIVAIIICSITAICIINNDKVNATCTTDSTTGVVTCTESASATVRVAEACTMTATNNTPHTAEIANGLYSGGISEYSNGIGKTTLKVVCNDASGFSIYAVGYTNNEFGNTKLMSNEQDATAPIINTGTYDSGNTSAWAMKVSPVTGTFAPTSDNSFNSFHNIPNVYTRVAYRTSGTDMNSDPSLATGSSVEATYAAYISPTQPAGTYVGKVKYTLVHPNSNTPKDAPITCAANKICYSPNANDVEGTMGIQSAGSNGTYTLLASNFSRKGYGFAGWSESQNAASDTTTKIYGPQEDITTGDLSSKGMSLYAVWVKSEGSIQDSSKVTAVCNRLTQAPTDGTANISSVSALTDQRDNETYAIAKLADGNCWMIENLRLDNTASLTIANTNSPLNDGTNVTLKHSYSDTETHNTLSASQDPTVTEWCTSDSASCEDQSMLFTGNTTNRASSPTTNGVAMYSYGNYYNWYSATAGRGTYSFGTNNSSVAGDLCPAGWHLPKGGRKANVDISDFWKLSRATIGADPANFANDRFYYTGTPEGTDASKKMRAYPNNFVYSGYVASVRVYDRGTNGGFWSSTAFSSIYAYSLGLYSSNVSPGTGNYGKYEGESIRCVAPAL